MDFIALIAFFSRLAANSRRAATRSTYCAVETGLAALTAPAALEVAERADAVVLCARDAMLADEHDLASRMSDLEAARAACDWAQGEYAAATARWAA